MGASLNRVFHEMLNVFHNILMIDPSISRPGMRPLAASCASPQHREAPRGRHPGSHVPPRRPQRHRVPAAADVQALQRRQDPRPGGLLRRLPRLLRRYSGSLAACLSVCPVRLVCGRAGSLFLRLFVSSFVHVAFAGQAVRLCVCVCAG